MTLSNLNTNKLQPTYVRSLINLGDWASVTAVAGTYTTGTYSDSDGAWKYWRWTATASASITTSGGLIEALLVSGGTAGTSGTYGGGNAVEGVFYLTSGTKAITIGAGGGVSGDPGVRAGTTSLIGTGAGSIGSGSVMTMTGAGWGQYSSGSLGGYYDPYYSTITGSSVAYGQSNTSAVTANSGNGGNGTTAGSSGVVIVRVPTNYNLTGA